MFSSGSQGPEGWTSAGFARACVGCVCMCVHMSMCLRKTEVDGYFFAHFFPFFFLF